MTTLKRICIPRGKMVASLVIIAGMLTSCGGARKQRNLYNDYSNIDELFARFSTNSNAFTPQQLSNLSQASSQNNSTTSSSGTGQINGTPVAPISSPNGGGTAGQLTLATAQDFGFLNSCYQQILTQGQGYFREGYTADSIFMGAGQEIVSCYQQVLQQRTQWMQQQQAYQQQLYQWQYQQKMQWLYNYYSNLNRSQVFETVRPPALGR